MLSHDMLIGWEEIAPGTHSKAHMKQRKRLMAVVDG